MAYRFLLPLPMLLLAACVAEPERTPSGGPRDGGSVVADGGGGDAGALNLDAGNGADAGTSSVGVAGGDFLERLAGLWTGPATRTPLGDFSMMNVDFRPASPQVVFGRTDVDEDNSLRFAFSVETHGGEDVLIYRNGGFFLGLLRDHRARLVEHEPGSSRWRFCHATLGCDYADALWDFRGPELLIFDVRVRGMQHVYWNARRVEAGELPAGFAEGLVSQGTGEAPFPPMPNLRTTVRWLRPLQAEAPVYLVLSNRECAPAECQPARQLRARARAGSNSVELNLEQVHPKTYFAFAILDRNDNLEMLGLPDSGDGVSLPNQRLTVMEQGTSTGQLDIVYDLP